MHIDNFPSRAFKGFDWSENSKVAVFIHGLFAEYTVWYKQGESKKRIRDSTKIQQHLTHFVLEAYRTFKASPDYLIGIHLGNSYYNSKTRYKPNHLSFRIVINVTQFLTAAGYLERPLGNSGWAPNKEDRRTTRFQATPKLIEAMDKHGINRFMIVPFPEAPPETIILRKAKKAQQSGVMEDYCETPFTLQARRSLDTINRFIAKHCINLDISNNQEVALQHNDRYIDFTKTSLKRIFNNSSFEEGGRFYGGWWQQIPSDYRLFITINSKRTVQLDYSGMYFAIMYAAMNESMPMEDPYALQGYSSHLRGDIKTASNIIINCRTPNEAINTIDSRIASGKLSTELGTGQKLLERFTQTHPLIKDKIASGDGVRGQFIDSQIAEKVLLKGISLNLCILPIHDGFITTKGDQHLLLSIMKKSFREVTDAATMIKPESFNLSVLDNDKGDDYWITRLDNTQQFNGPLEGKAIAYAQAISKESLWKSFYFGNDKARTRLMDWDTANNV